MYRFRVTFFREGKKVGFGEFTESGENQYDAWLNLKLKLEKQGQDFLLDGWAKV